MATVSLLRQQSEDAKLAKARELERQRNERLTTLANIGRSLLGDAWDELQGKPYITCGGEGIALQYRGHTKSICASMLTQASLDALGAWLLTCDQAEEEERQKRQAVLEQQEHARREFRAKALAALPAEIPTAARVAHWCRLVEKHGLASDWELAFLLADLAERTAQAEQEVRRAQKARTDAARRRRIDALTAAASLAELEETWNNLSSQYRGEELYRKPYEERLQKFAEERAAAEKAAFRPFRVYKVHYGILTDNDEYELDWIWSSSSAATDGWWQRVSDRYNPMSLRLVYAVEQVDVRRSEDIPDEPEFQALLPCGWVRVPPARYVPLAEPEW